ncbi:MAG TPA: 30S ribosomal protein S13, partial [Nanoarchaeota archaeon]|nr:30S ribosomal protein S13 [Nanoarchaeota archaeon]
TLSDTEIKALEETIKSLHTRALPTFILNKPKMHEGAAKHLIGTDLELQLRTDIRGMRDIQSYKGIRHALGLPVRGQRTKSHFRHGRAVGVTKKKAPPAKAAPKTGGK